MKFVVAAAFGVALMLSPGAHAQTPEGTWLSEDGRTYKASLTLNGSGTAKVQGCVLAVLCKSHIWTRSN